MQRRLFLISLSVIAVFVSFGCSDPLHTSFNQPGEPIDLRRNLAQGKYTVFYYYADSCPACKKWAPTMQAVNSHFSDMAVRYINIESFDSDVARLHHISFVPNFKIFDPSGRPIAEGKAADAWIRAQIERRVGRRR